MSKQDGPKVLLLDIETAYMEVTTWGIRDQYIDIGQITEDWSIIAWCAKWLGKPKLYYKDNRDKKNKRDDKDLLKQIWTLLDEADVIITQNGKSFDEKKLNARFLINGFKPPSSYKHIDTKLIASRKFGFTSNKLEYMTNLLNKKYKKLSHKAFPGRELWTECMKGNKKAWNEMRRYNQYDVLSLEELYLTFRAWDNSLNVNLYTSNNSYKCACGSSNLQKYGFRTTASGRFQRFKCQDCGAETISKVNLLSKDKIASLKEIRK